jgi:hypothetical protein
LSSEYTEERLEAASALAVPLDSLTRKIAKSLRGSGQDLRQIAPEDFELPSHGDVFGVGYHH